MAENAWEGCSGLLVARRHCSPLLEPRRGLQMAARIEDRHGRRTCRPRYRAYVSLRAGRREPGARPLPRPGDEELPAIAPTHVEGAGLAGDPRRGPGVLDQGIMPAGATPGILAAPTLDLARERVAAREQRAKRADRDMRISLSQVLRASPPEFDRGPLPFRGIAVVSRSKRPRERPLAGALKPLLHKALGGWSG